jgi:Flp pilus assembly protein TadG
MTRPPPPAPAGDQQGIVTIEFVAVVWVFMVLVLGAAQFGLWWHVALPGFHGHVLACSA